MNTLELRTMDDYRRLHRQSIVDPHTFWGDQAQRLRWFHPPEDVVSEDTDSADFTWYGGGRLNAAVNCVDRHAEATPQKVALIWAKDEPGEYRRITFRELQAEVGRLANVLRNYGVQRGDRVCLYLPMVPELVYAMLACARIGAVHSVCSAASAPSPSATVSWTPAPSWSSPPTRACAATAASR